MAINYQDTSRAAYESFAPISGRLDGLIVATLREHGALTCEQIERNISRSHQAVSGNLRHLVEKGHVIKSGDFGLTRSGRKAIKWKLAPPQSK